MAGIVAVCGSITADILDDCARLPPPASAQPRRHFQTLNALPSAAGYFRRRLHRRETLACPCGQYIITARVTDKTAHGSGGGSGVSGIPA